YHCTQTNSTTVFGAPSGTASFDTTNFYSEMPNGNLYADLQPPAFDLDDYEFLNESYSNFLNYPSQLDFELNSDSGIETGHSSPSDNSSHSGSSSPGSF